MSLAAGVIGIIAISKPQHDLIRIASILKFINAILVSVVLIIYIVILAFFEPGYAIGLSIFAVPFLGLEYYLVYVIGVYYKEVKRLGAEEAAAMETAQLIQDRI